MVDPNFQYESNSKPHLLYEYYSNLFRALIETPQVYTYTCKYIHLLSLQASSKIARSLLYRSVISYTTICFSTFSVLLSPVAFGTRREIKFLRSESSHPLFWQLHSDCGLTRYYCRVHRYKGWYRYIEHVYLQGHPLTRRLSSCVPSCPIPVYQLRMHYGQSEITLDVVFYL